MMKNVCFRAMVLLAVLLFSFAVQAANVGPSGYTNDFSSIPDGADWASSTRAGGQADVYDQDVDVQTNIAALVVTQAVNSSSSDPIASATRAGWSSTGLYVQTRPTANRYTTLMGKFSNGTGTNATEIAISYRVTFGGTTVAEEPGRGTHVYYSLTGLSNSWVNLPTLNTVS